MPPIIFVFFLNIFLWSVMAIMIICRKLNCFKSGKQMGEFFRAGANLFGLAQQ